MSFTQTRLSNHPNASGLLFGGSDLSGPSQRCSYFVVREDGQFLLLAAKPLGEPVARYGPFVMNTQEELRQTLQDLRDSMFLG